MGTSCWMQGTIPAWVHRLVEFAPGKQNKEPIMLPTEHMILQRLPVHATLSCFPHHPKLHQVWELTQRAERGQSLCILHLMCC